MAGEEVQSAELILAASVPLLRGAGTVAREDRIQAERGVIYAARSFERFRRDFAFDIAVDFLNLVVQKQGIGNGERELQGFVALEEREQGLVASGRDAPVDLSLAQQDVAFSRDRLAGSRESYRLSVDRFKVRIGMSSPDGR